MKDANKTKDQLINELVEMRQQIEKLETAETERKQAEEGLRESEEKFRNLVEQSNDAIYILQEEKFVFINSRFQELLGYSLEETIAEGFDFMNLVVPESRALIKERVEKAARGESLDPRYEFKGLAKDGNKIDFEVSVTYINYRGNTAVQGILRDVTERKQAAEVLRESEKKYRDLVETIADVIYAVDQNGVVTYVSPVIESLLGYNPSEIIGRSFAEFIYHEDLPRSVEGFQGVLSGYITTGNYRILTKSGKIRWMRTSNRPIFEGNYVIGASGVLTDITDRKQAEETIREHIEELETFKKITVDRELKMIELKNEIKELKQRLSDMRET